MTLKEARLKRGLTQKELGEKAGLSQAAIGMIENGKRGYSTKSLKRLSEVLNVSPAKLLVDA